MEKWTMRYRISKNVKDRIKALVEDARLRGLARLPAERALARTFKVSRATVSKAISQLVGEGVLSRKQGSGTYILAAHRSAKSICLGVGFRHSYSGVGFHFPRLVKGISEEASEAGAHIQIFGSLAEQFRIDPEHNSLMKCIEADIIQGFVVCSRMPVEVIGAIAGRIPTVVVNSKLETGNLPCVFCDHFTVGFMASTCLLDHGHERIGYVYDDINSPEVISHVSGLRAGLKSRGGRFDDALMIWFEKDRDAFVTKMSNMISQHRLTAFLVRNDGYAAKVISLMLKAGIQVPQDVSVVGVGNYEYWVQCPVRLTSIDTRLEDMGRIAGKQLISMVEDNAPENLFTIVEPVLVERDSVMGIGKRV